MNCNAVTELKQFSEPNSQPIGLINILEKRNKPIERNLRCHRDPTASTGCGHCTRTDQTRLRSRISPWHLQASCRVRNECPLRAGHRDQAEVPQVVHYVPLKAERNTSNAIEFNEKARITFRYVNLPRIWCHVSTDYGILIPLMFPLILPLCNHVSTYVSKESSILPFCFP